jgi:head-tail adaptor
MKGIGGNITATIQTYTITRNSIGEQVKSWTDIQTIKGWLDLQAGDSKYTTFNAKLQESTHIFIADFVPLADDIQAENSRMIINGKRYDILLIDNPMEMGYGSQLEIYLKYTGGQ